MESLLLSSAVSSNLEKVHNPDLYSSNILEYGDFIGVESIAIYKLDGLEAFQSRALQRPLEETDRGSFQKSIESMNVVDVFDRERKVFTRFTPFVSDSSCVSCHAQADEVLGVLKTVVSTESDFELLDWTTGLVWGLGLIMVMAIAGLLLASLIIREKNKIYLQLEERSETLKETFHSLDETKSYLQMILDYSKAIIVTTDTAGHIVEFNKEAELLTGFSKEEVVGRSILSFCTDQGQRKELIHVLKQAQLSNNRSWEVRNQEVKITTKSGDNIYISATYSPLMDSPEKEVGTVVVCKDISEQIQLQFKLMQSEKLAGIGTLASGVAHEINNPLSGILGMAEAAKEEEDQATSRSYMDFIIRYTLAASDIVKELASYSRTAVSKSKTPVDVAVAIEDALRMSSHSAPFRSIKVDCDLDKESFISANAGELQQIFVNLIVNAIHAMDEKGVLTLRCLRKGEDIIAIIADTGNGIPKKHLSQIYDPFFTTKPAGKGTGLGLYVVYKLVTKYGGSFDCVSKEGAGTSFTLGFPALSHGKQEGSDA